MVRVVVVGGGPAGVSTALACKELSEDVEVVLVRKDEKQLIPCGIPYMFTRFSIGENLLSDALLAKYGVKLVIDRAVGIDRDGRRLILEKYGELPYDYLVLATGSRPSKLNVKGEHIEGVFYVKDDYEKLMLLRERLEESSSVLIVGGGLAGVEVADELARKGYEVSIVEALPHILMLNFDPEFATLIEKYFKDLGVNVFTNTSVLKFEGEGELREVVLSNGVRVKADVSIITVGITPNTLLAEKTGLEVSKYGVKVNQYMVTSDPRIYAVGDCAEKKDLITGKPAKYMLASIATMEGRVAAVNIVKGNVLKVKGVVPKYVSKVGDMVFGAAGLTEKQAKENGLGYVSSMVSAKDKYPSALSEVKDLTVKLLFSRKGFVIGGQVIGFNEYVGALVNTIGVLVENNVIADNLLSIPQAAHPLVTPSPISEPLAKISLEIINELKRG
ncbi:MAG: pyridine nucleotide-disulfide oxidoreductase [Thermoprotei archaeon]|nr:MAG: pyridine nucleotide-disulfide oxidoreductase [Thermoprotei archaeon]